MVDSEETTWIKQETLENNFISFLEMFETQVKVNPEKIALSYQNSNLTYKEVDLQAEIIGKKLINNGLNDNEIVTLMVRRSPFMIIGIIGILKASGAYLPIDPSMPEKRIKYLINNSKSCILLTESSLKVSHDFSGKVILIDDEIATNEQGVLVDRKLPKPTDLAYVIYTSGSTGKPKGVMIEHRALSNFIQGMIAQIAFTPEKSILALTTISFDIFVLESLLPLVLGMRIVIADESVQKNPKLLANLIITSGVEMVQMTPSLLQLLINYQDDLTCFNGLQEIMIGGEVFPASLLTKIQKVTDAKIYNMYGPTETTVWVSVSDLTTKNKVDLGQPIKNTSFYILDENHHIQPNGVEGELFITSESLARGYLHDDNLTEERFIVNPLNPGEWMYKTGDYVRRTLDGVFEYLGRKDNQVKVRGYRIELEEVESALLAYAKIQQAVVQLLENEAEDKCLVAYYVSDRELEQAEIRNYLMTLLPEYMVPGVFIAIESMPLTPNGKIDRSAFRVKAYTLKNKGVKEGENLINPDDDIKSKLIEIIRENIMIPESVDVGQIAVDGGLAELGIDSINFIKITVAIEMEFGIEFDDDNLFLANYPDLQSLVYYIKAEQAGVTDVTHKRKEG